MQLARTHGPVSDSHAEEVLSHAHLATHCSACESFSIFSHACLASRAKDWQRVDGTSFLVDCFGKQAQMLKCRSWFLTHFHSDHYKGLRGSFKAGATLLQPCRCSEQPVYIQA